MRRRAAHRRHQHEGDRRDDTRDAAEAMSPRGAILADRDLADEERG